MRKALLIIGIALWAIPIFAAKAHPGRTDSSGCHTCRTNCASWGLSSGEYHCHNAKALPQPEEPIKSHYGENGTGYTTSAPEYKAPAEVKGVEVTNQENTNNSPAKANSNTQINTNNTTAVLNSDSNSSSDDSGLTSAVVIIGITGVIYSIIRRKKKKSIISSTNNAEKP